MAAPLKVISLTESDRQILMEVIAEKKARVKNTVNRPRAEPELGTAPEMYVVVAPDGGIPAMSVLAGTGTGSWDTPGSAECPVYKRVGTELEEVSGLFRVVYNLGDAITAGETAPAWRDKFGTWWVRGVSAGLGTLNAVGAEDFVPFYTDVYSLRFAETDGFTISATGVAPFLQVLVNFAAATTTQKGAVTTSTQSWAGSKILDDPTGSGDYQFGVRGPFTLSINQSIVAGTLYMAVGHRTGSQASPDPQMGLAYDIDITSPTSQMRLIAYGRTKTAGTKNVVFAVERSDGIHNGVNGTMPDGSVVTGGIVTSIAPGTGTYVGLSGALTAGKIPKASTAATLADSPLTVSSSTAVTMVGTFTVNDATDGVVLFGKGQGIYPATYSGLAFGSVGGIAIDYNDGTIHISSSGNAVQVDATSIGFYGTAPVTIQDVSGVSTGFGALKNLLNALVALGLITDSTT